MCSRLAGALRIAALLVIAGCHGEALANATAYARYPIRLSADGTYLVDQDARPFFINGDTAWSLLGQLTEEEADAYLADRARRGYNAVLVSLIERKFASHAPANRAGAPPFLETGRIGTPNDAYFAHVDRVLARAATRGVLVLLAPIYLGYECGDEGWCAETRASSAEDLRAFGAYIGRRYAAQPNIIWVIGGDADPSAHRLTTRLRAFVDGLRSVDRLHLLTAHNAPEQSAMDPWNPTNHDRWLTLNNIYSYHDPRIAALAQLRHPVRTPFFLIESAYENERGSTPRSLRQQAYSAVLAGATAGHVFGNCPVWNFGAPSASAFCANHQWRTELDSPGSKTLALVGRLFTSRPFHKLIPDATRSIVAAGESTEANSIRAARTSDGSCIIAYIAEGHEIVADLRVLSASGGRAWWFDPRTGSARLIGEARGEKVRFELPTSEEDWVLVIDAASLNFPAPIVADTQDHDSFERVD